jgi:hypothetical protein
MTLPKTRKGVNDPIKSQISKIPTTPSTGEKKARGLREARVTRPATRRRGCTSGQRRRHLPPPTRPPPPCFWRRTEPRDRDLPAGRPNRTTPTSAAHPKPPTGGPACQPAPRSPRAFIGNLLADITRAVSPRTHARTAGWLPARPPCRVARAGGGEWMAGGPAPCGDLRSERRFRVKKKGKRERWFRRTR